MGLYHGQFLQTFLDGENIDDEIKSWRLTNVEILQLLFEQQSCGNRYKNKSNLSKKNEPIKANEVHLITS